MKTRERPPVVLDSNHTAQITHKHHTTAETHWWCSELHSAICRNTNGRLKTLNNTFKFSLQSLYSKETVWLTMATLLVCSRVRIRSLLTVVSAMSALSSASSSSCWTFLKRTVLQLTCSSWWTHRGTTAAIQFLWQLGGSRNKQWTWLCFRREDRSSS